MFPGSHIEVASSAIPDTDDFKQLVNNEIKRAIQEMQPQQCFIQDFFEGGEMLEPGAAAKF